MQVEDFDGEAWEIDTEPYYFMKIRMWRCSKQGSGVSGCNDAAIRTTFGQDVLDRLVLEASFAL